MKKENIQKIKWLASFDIEPLLSAILRNGTLWAFFMILSSLVIYLQKGEPIGNLGDNFIARSLPTLLSNDFKLFGSNDFWVHFLLHLGFSILLLTTYFRLLASMLYFGWIEKSRMYAWFTGFVLMLLTVGLFTNIV